MADFSKRTELRVRGTGLLGRATSDLDTRDVTIDLAFEVVLVPAGGGAELFLEDVRYLDSSTLSAALPSGGATGWYAAEVRGPYGVGARKSEAFKIYSDHDEDGIHDDEDTCVDADRDGFGRAGYNQTTCPYASDDLDDEDASVCADTDGDGCEDCVSGQFQPFADGPDLDGDGFCALGDCDDSALSGALCGNSCTTFYNDADGDGFGNVAATIQACTQPVGFASNASDCDDNPLVCGSDCFPGNSSSDLCDGFDQDCDGSTDEDVVAWWDLDWQFRRRLDMNNSGQPEAIADFPVLVVLDVATFDYANAAVDGSDLRFIDDDGVLELTHHIELWNPSGQSFVWVQVPVIDASSTADHFWFYYGAISSVPDTQDESGTYDANYVGVWHLDETSGAHVDSAAGISCSWIGGGLGTQDAVGQIGGANDFDGDEDGATCGTDQIADTTGSTITAWVNLSLTGDANQEIVALEFDALPYRGLGLNVRASDGALGKWFGTSFKYGNNPGGHVVANEWTFIAIRGVKAALGVLEVSKNGGTWESIVSGNTLDLALQPAAPLVLGKWPGSLPNEATRGRIDEIQISNVARSDSWVRAQHLSSGNTFVSDTGQELQCP